MNDLEKQVKKISNLSQYKKRDKSEIEAIAQRLVWIKQINIEEKFKSTEDKKLAKTKFENYLNNYTFQNFTDIQNVADIVFKEIIHLRLQQSVAKISADNTNNFNPGKSIEYLHDLEEDIAKLKEKAGIVGSKDQDDLSILQVWIKKLKVWLNFNRNEATLFMPFDCRHCGKKDVQPILLRRRVKDFDVLRHPVFAGRFLFNFEIIDDVEAGKITKEMAARYMRTSPHYIQWCIENRHKIIPLTDSSKEDMDERIRNTPHLGNPEDYHEEN